MLVALLTILLLGGSSTGVLEYIGDTRDAVKNVMPKGDARKAALSTLKAMKKRTSAHNKTAKRAAKEIAKAFVDHETVADTLDTIWAGYFVQVNKRDADMLDLRFELRESISREEWEAIFTDPE